MSISNSIKKQKEKRKRILWQGPEDDGPMGGVSQSLLNRFVVDRERFRLYAIEGLRAQEGFNHRIEFGNLWHSCEQAYAGGEDVKPALDQAAKELMEKYPFSAQDIKKWWNVIKIQFPVYIQYWSKKDKTKKGTDQNLTPLLQEQVFHVPYILPSGRTVWLKGKWDRVDLYHIHPITHKKKDGIWLGEHKTKGDLGELDVRRRLTFDIQTMIYLIALKEADPGADLMGVNYNVIRRPFSGGKGSIKKHKPNKKNPRGESDAEFYARLRDGYIAKDPDQWFARWNIEVTTTDIERFKKQFLNPILEILCDWYEWVIKMKDPFDSYQDGSMAGGGLHYRTPYGIYNPILEGASTDVDNYLDTGSELGLVRVDTLFSELQ